MWCCGPTAGACGPEAVPEGGIELGHRSVRRKQLLVSDLCPVQLARVCCSPSEVREFCLNAPPRATPFARSLSGYSVDMSLESAVAGCGGGAWRAAALPPPHRRSIVYWRAEIAACLHVLCVQARCCRQSRLMCALWVAARRASAPPTPSCAPGGLRRRVCCPPPSQRQQGRSAEVPLLPPVNSISS